MIKLIGFFIQNKNEISSELYNKIVNQYPSYSCGIYVHPGILKLGVTSCSFTPSHI